MNIKPLFLLFLLPLMIFSVPLVSIAAMRAQQNSPSAVIIASPAPTLAPTPTLSTEERLSKLEAAIETPQKDVWDKISAISGLITGGVIAIVGAVITLLYNIWQQRSEKTLKMGELAVLQMNTVQNFMPQLQSGDPKAIQAALLAIGGLGNKDLAAKLAALFITSSDDPAVITAIERSLEAILQFPMQAIVQISHGGAIKGIGFFAKEEGYILTTHHSVNTASEVSVVTREKTIPATTVKTWPEDNLALLKITTQQAPVLPLLLDSKVQLGDRVYLVGRESEVGLTIQPANVTSFGRLDAYKSHELIIVNASISLESGGAPVFATNGQMLGTVIYLWTEGDVSTRAYILPVTAIRKVLANYFKRERYEFFPTTPDES
jgi:S1-C subfamily serine protease